MIQNCQQFEDRIQELMDQRIDPETDDLICAHVRDCEACNESMMAFSVLHTTYLNDSDSMKIKLDNLGLHEVLAKRKQERPERGNIIAIVASLSAALLLFAALSGIGGMGGGNTIWGGLVDAPVAIGIPSDMNTPIARSHSVSLDSFIQVKRNLDRNEIYGSLSELPGISPFRALSTYFDWLHESWASYSKFEETSPDLGGAFQLNPNQQYLSNSLFAARI